MTIPQSVTQATILLLAIIPGFVFSAVRARRRGPSPEDKDFSVRLLRAFGVSALLAAVYLGVFGSWGVTQVSGLFASPAEGFVVRNPRFTAVIAVILLGVVPSALAVLDDLRQEGRLDFGKFRFAYKGRYHPAPSAWDFAGPQLGETFIRIRLDDGSWVGGWFGPDSFLSSYPEPRDIFIQSQWELSEVGEFQQRIQGTRGVYVSCAEAVIIEWVDPPSS